MTTSSFSFVGAAATSIDSPLCAVQRQHGEASKKPDGDSVRTDLDGALSDHGAVGLVDDAIDLLEIVRVGDDLVAGDEVLFEFAGSEPFFLAGHTKSRISREKQTL